MALLTRKRVKDIFLGGGGLIRPSIVYLLDTIFVVLLSKRPYEKIEKKKQVLIVRLDVIGDFILWLDSAKEFRKIYPEKTHQITLLANAVWAPIAEFLPYFDVVWPIERLKFYKNLRYRFQQFLKVRRASFDIVIQPTFSREFLFGDSIVRLCGAKERIGSISDCTHLRPWLKPTSDAWYTKLIHATAKPLMELERNAEVMRGLGLEGFQASIPSLTVFDGPEVGARNYFVISPGSFMPFKQWDVDCFRTIARRVHSVTGWRMIVCGGLGEEQLAADLVRDIGFSFDNCVGSTSLLDLVSIISSARLVIANDTSAIHIAAAVSTPAICILGGGHYGRFLPYKIKNYTHRPLPVAVVHPMDCFGCNWKCRYDVPTDRAMPCIENITADDVWGAVEEAIAKISVVE